MSETPRLLLRESIESFFPMSTLPLSRHLVFLDTPTAVVGAPWRTPWSCTPDFASAEGFQSHPAGKCRKMWTHSAPSVGDKDGISHGQATAPQQRVLRQFSCQGSGLQFLRRTECEPLLSTNVTLFLTTATTLVCRPRSLTPRM